MREDAAHDENGKASAHGDSNEDRCAAYRRWHRLLGREFPVLDVDQVEWRKRECGELYPVATIELTRVDGDRPVPPGYLSAILGRFDERDFQGRHSRVVAEALDVKCWIVAFRWDLGGFWVYNLTDGQGWFPDPHDSSGYDAHKYKRWLRRLA